PKPQYGVERLAGLLLVRIEPRPGAAEELVAPAVEELAVEGGGGLGRGTELRAVVGGRGRPGLPLPGGGGHPGQGPGPCVGARRGSARWKSPRRNRSANSWARSAAISGSGVTQSR